MNHLLFDNGISHGHWQFWHDSFKKRGIPLTVFHNKGGWDIKLWLKDTIKFINSTTSDDTLIFWADVQGVMGYWHCLMTFKRRRMVIVNILLKDKATLKNNIATFLYKKALNSERVAYTVTSAEYGEALKNRLGIRPACCIVHDLCLFSGTPAQEAAKVTKPFENYAFSGGRNSRDWDRVHEVASNMPGVNFCLVMTRNDYNKHADKFAGLKNCDLYCDLPFDKYHNLLQNSDLGYFPLDTQAPAVLSDIFQTIDMGKPVLTSDTETTREYMSVIENCLSSLNG